VLEKLGPALEVVDPGHDQLGVSETEWSFRHVCDVEALEPRVVRSDYVDCAAFPSLEGLHEVLGLLSGLLEADARRKRIERHDDPLS
jgi:hypothetical protein